MRRQGRRADLDAERIAWQVAELKRIWRLEADPALPLRRPRLVYVPAAGVIARSLLYRDH